MIANDLQNNDNIHLTLGPEAHSKHSQTPKMESFAKIVNDSANYFLTILVKSSILDIWTDSESASNIPRSVTEKYLLERYIKVLRKFLQISAFLK